MRIIAIFERGNTKNETFWILKSLSQNKDQKTKAILHDDKKYLTNFKNS